MRSKKMPLPVVQLCDIARSRGARLVQKCDVARERVNAHIYRPPQLCNLKFQWHKSLMRLSLDPFPIFEGEVRQS